MPDIKPISLKIRFKNEDATRGVLDLYDGTSAMFGMAKALQITTHAFVNHEVIKHSTALKGARLYFAGTKKGSVVETVSILIQQYPIASTIGLSVLSNALYDFLKVSIGRAVGHATQPSTPSITRIATEDEPFFDSLSEALEGPLREAHRTIHESGGVVLIERPSARLLQLDGSTMNYVFSREENPSEETISGSVTRYNVVSGNGRLYDKDMRRIVPFRLDKDISEEDIRLLSWSLDQVNNQADGDLEFVVKRIVSASEVTKRYFVLSCKTK
jgi:hypothetical protein